MTPLRLVLCRQVALSVQDLAMLVTPAAAKPWWGLEQVHWQLLFHLRRCVLRACLKVRDCSATSGKVMTHICARWRTFMSAGMRALASL